MTHYDKDINNAWVYDKPPNKNIEIEPRIEVSRRFTTPIPGKTWQNDFVQRDKMKAKADFYTEAELEAKINKFVEKEAPWAKKIVSGLMDIPAIPKVQLPISVLKAHPVKGHITHWEDVLAKEKAQSEYEQALNRQVQFELKKAAADTIKPKRTRYPAYKKDDRVNTPNGPGNVWSVDRDGTVCVELDADPSILHEFEKKELKKIK